MRILYSHRVQSRDGQGVHIDELVRALRAAGHTVNMVGPSFYEKGGDGAGSALVGLARRIAPATAAWAELAYDYQAYRRLKHAHRVFKPDLIYERCNLFFSAGARVARETGTLFYLEVNSPLAQERMEHGGLKLAARAARLEMEVWRAADRVLPVTAVLADILVAAGVQPAQVSVIPNGVDLSRFPPRGPRPADKPISLGFVGFVRAWHGLDRVITGMAGNPGGPPVTLTIVGDGPARAELEALAQQLNIADRVGFTGVVPPEKVAPLVAEFDIALQPQATPYASPLKIFDYMAAGCAIVAPDQPNIREILEHERTALLFNPNDSAALWQAISRLIDDPALRRRLAVAARAELEAKDYTWHGNARRIAQWAAGQMAKP